MLRRKHGKVYNFFSTNRERTRKRLKITYRIKFIDSVRFLASSLSNLPKNLAERLHNNKCKDCKSYLEFIEIREKLLIFKCIK